MKPQPKEATPLKIGRVLIRSQKGERCHADKGNRDYEHSKIVPKRFTPFANDITERRAYHRPRYQYKKARMPGY